MPSQRACKKSEDAPSSHDGNCHRVITEAIIAATIASSLRAFRACEKKQHGSLIDQEVVLPPSPSTATDLPNNSCSADEPLTSSRRLSSQHAGGCEAQAEVQASFRKAP
jgi:hypothetical protein